VLVVAVIIVLATRITDPGPGESRPAFDVGGAVLCAAGLFFVVLGILQSNVYGWFASRKDFSVGGTVVIAKGGVSPIWLLIALGALVLAWFVMHLRGREKRGRQPLLALRLFRNHTANLGLATQCVQWLILQGTFFIVSVFLQKIRGFSAIETGLVLTPATAGILASSAAAERFAKRHSQRWLIRVGFVITVAGMALLLALVREKSGVWTFVPGLLLMGLGVGTMLTSSVNVVQSAFTDSDQGDISGLSRSVSNLGSSLGTALAGSIMVAAAVPGGRPYAMSMVVLTVIALAGLAFAMWLPPAEPTTRP
jgi:predicted MFS family arabinose efflux permease